MGLEMLLTSSANAFVQHSAFFVSAVYSKYAALEHAAELHNRRCKLMPPTMSKRHARKYRVA